MRITSNMSHEQLFGTNNSKLNKNLFDVNKQIASRIKIQYASEDVGVFIGTMQLDNEMTMLTQVKKSTENALKVSKQTDIALGDFTKTLTDMRTLLLNAANNGPSSEVSLNAIASEMRGLEKHLINLANTSINGEFLFSGSAVDIRPIGDDGKYHGNDLSMNAFLGSRLEQQYNISGAELFFGEESMQKREISSNVENFNMSTKYPDFSDSSKVGSPIYLQSSDTIRDLMGDTDKEVTPANNHYFYLQGTKSDGESFNKKISLKDDDKIENLLNEIGNAYGNTASVKVVNVSMNTAGQIVIQDKIKGSSKLDFHLVGAVDFKPASPNISAADVTNIDYLKDGETNFDKIMFNNSSATNPNLFIKEFMKSSFAPATGAPSIEGLVYDKAQFSKVGDTVSSNVSQIKKADNTFATSSTKLAEVASGSLDKKTFKLVGTSVDGNDFSVGINLEKYDPTATPPLMGSTFSINENTYNIFNMKDPRTAIDASEMTYQQLMDVVNMAVSGTFPLPALPAGAADAYDEAIKDSKVKTQTLLSHDGKLEITDKNSQNTNIKFSMYDLDSGNFSTPPALPVASVMTFQANNALTVTDPKTDFFKSINDMIVAVENNKNHSDGSSGVARNIGIQNGIALMNTLEDHVQKIQSKVGTQSKSLSISLERTEVMEINTMVLRSSIIDTDLAESALRLSQLKLNQEALYSLIGKVSKLSLVNYL